MVQIEANVTGVGGFVDRILNCHLGRNTKLASKVLQITFLNNGYLVNVHLHMNAGIS